MMTKQICHIPEVPIHTPMERSRPSPQMNQTSPIYHDEFDSLAPKVVPDTNYSISRSISPVNPALSQVKLTDLSAKSVFIWGEQMILEHQNYPYEVLQWGRYIHPKITKLIQAHNDSSGLYRPVKLIGLFITMDNDNFWELILRIVRPSSYEE